MPHVRAKEYPMHLRLLNARNLQRDIRTLEPASYVESDLRSTVPKKQGTRAFAEQERGCAGRLLRSRVRSALPPFLRCCIDPVARENRNTSVQGFQRGAGTRENDHAKSTSNATVRPSISAFVRIGNDKRA